jgi:acyl dehydratase
MAPVIDAGIVGLTVGPMASVVDARSLMAYAAALGETDPRYYDTTAPGGPLAHPLFPVCYEWPVALALRAKAIVESLAPLSVHATHALVLHRPPRAGDGLRTTARVTRVQRRRHGTLVVMQHTTMDRAGRLVSATDYGSLYRGVDLHGAEAAAPGAASRGGAPTAPVRWEEAVAVSALAAHVYTEGARIYNPIHTDIAVARAAGLPGLILHGTATLALAVSRVVARDLGGDPTRVRGVAARFAGMVTMPSTFVVRGRRRDGDRLEFDAVSAAGAPVLTEAAVTA